MALTKDQEKEIYVAYKEIFSKEFSYLRKSKRVQQRIHNTRSHPITWAVIGKYGQDEILKTIRMLLEAKVFESEKIAKMRFSKGEPSPPPTPELNTSKPKVVESQTQNPGPVKELPQDPLDSEQKGVAFTNIDFLLGIAPDPIKVIEPTKVEQDEHVQVPQVCDSSSVEADEKSSSSSSHMRERDSEIPKETTELELPIINQGKASKVAASEEIRLSTTLSPTKKTKANAPISPSYSSDVFVSSRKCKTKWSQFLQLFTHVNRPAPQSPVSPQKSEDTDAPTQANPPFRIQHAILKRIQTILEHACFDFAKENMPEILRIMQWDCPEAGELNIWACQLGKRLDDLELRARSKGVKLSLKCLLSSVTQVRHIAVHRQSIHGNYLALLASHAVAFCAILEVPGADALNTLQTIRDSVKTQLWTLSDLKHDIDTELDNALDGIAARRAELDASEQKCIQEAHNKFESNRAIAWNKVDRLLLCTESEPYLLTVPKEPPVGRVRAMPALWANARLFLGQILCLAVPIMRLLIRCITDCFHMITSDRTRQSLWVIILFLFVPFSLSLLHSLGRILSTT
jgi:hypothetical protein